MFILQDRAAVPEDRGIPQGVTVIGPASPVPAPGRWCRAEEPGGGVRPAIAAHRNADTIGRLRRPWHRSRSRRRPPRRQPPDSARQPREEDRRQGLALAPNDRPRGAPAGRPAPHNGRDHAPALAEHWKTRRLRGLTVVVAEDAVRLVGGARQECLGAAALVVLTGKAHEIVVQRLDAAIEPLAIMLLADGRLPPGDAHLRSERLRAAASSAVSVWADSREA